MKTITRFIYTTFAVISLAIGAVTANGAVGDLFASVNGSGSNGGGFIYQYTSTGVQSIFASGLSRPRGVAFDHVGNLFVANTTFDGTTFQASIVKITPGGVQNTFAILSGNLFGEGVAFDSAGNLLVVAGEQTGLLPCPIYKITPDGVQSAFGNLPMGAGGLAFDGAGNLFAGGGDENGAPTIYKFTPDGTRSIFVGPSAFTIGGPAGLAFDRFGNLFVSTESGCPPAEPDRILKFTPDGVESAFATDLTIPRGLALDRAGNLFATEGFCDPTGSSYILKFTPDGTSSVFAVVPGRFNSGPEFLAFQLSPPTPPHPTPAPRSTPRH